MLACGGQKGEIAIWDVCENKQIEDNFKGYLPEGTYDVKDYDPNAQNTGGNEEEFEDMEDEENNSDYDDEDEDQAQKKSKSINQK